MTNDIPNTCLILLEASKVIMEEQLNLSIKEIYGKDNLRSSPS